MSLEQLRIAADPGYAFRILVGHKCDPWQRSLLEEAAGLVVIPTPSDPRDFVKVEKVGAPLKKFHVNVGRQGGKTCVSAALLTWWLTYHKPGTTALIASPSERQSKLMFAKVTENVRKLPEGAARIVGENQTELRMEVGGRVSTLVALPGEPDNLRGYTCSLVCVDEAARCDEAIWAAVTPALATTNGVRILLSTPCGPQGKFYELDRDQLPDWRYFKIPSSQNPRISASFLEEEKRDLGWRYAAEHENSFTAGLSGSFFDLGAIDRASVKHDGKMLF